MPSPGPGKELTFIHTLVLIPSWDLTEQRMREALRGKTREWACGSEELATFLRDGVTITYRYKGKNGIVIGDITVSQADC